MPGESIPTPKPKNLVANIEEVGVREREYKKKYAAIPAAKPFMFQTTGSEGVSQESPFVFLPVSLDITPEKIESLISSYENTGTGVTHSKLAKHLEKLAADTTVLGDFEVACIMRAHGDNNRIDKMIAEIDTHEPWLAGKIEHLLLLAQTNPELFDEPVVALGSEIKQTGAVSCIEKWDGKLGYSNHPKHAGFNRNYRFLIYRKKNPE